MNTRLRFRAGALLALATLPVPATSGAAQVTCPWPDDLIGGRTGAIAHVRYLADDALEGRGSGTPGERCAGEYIAAAFRRAGLEPAGADGTFFQDVSLASTLNPHLPGGTGRNVVGILPGADPVLRDELIVIGAHYDHLGRGGTGSLAPGSSEIHNGADDNASGVATLLETALALGAAARPARSVLFVAFTGEELGLLGSAQFVGQGGIEPARMKAMLNMDMVGRLESDPLIVYGVDTAEEWRGIVERAAAEQDIEIAPRGEGYGPSDHTSFYTRDVPVLHFFTNVHGDYHQPGDDWEKIDAAGLTRIAAMVTDIAAELASRPTRLTLVRGAGAPQPAAEGQSRGYGAYLGSVPDFTPAERGVLLSGVGPGSPAEQAGIRAGDVIVGLGDHEVADLQGLTDALRAHRPGDVVQVRYLRDGREATVQVTLGSRASR